jgi:TetR/AcrR family transcriptional regulator, tetracycline repressor protein
MIATPTHTEGPGRRVGLDADAVVDCALAIVEQEGADALTMRRLAADLGVTTTTVYWHVGGREAVIGALIERHAQRIAGTEVEGDSARERVLSASRNLWESALAHPNVTGLAHRSGASSAVNFPLHIALARELESAGVRGPAARDALNAIVCCVAGFLVLRLRSTGPRDLSGESLWATVTDDGIDPTTVLALVDPVDLDRLFEPTLRAVVDRYVPG